MLCVRRLATLPRVFLSNRNMLVEFPLRRGLQCDSRWALLCFMQASGLVCSYPNALVIQPRNFSLATNELDNGAEKGRGNLPALGTCHVDSRARIAL